MGGKSTYMRQAALIVILAHIGAVSYQPARTSDRSTGSSPASAQLGRPVGWSFDVHGRDDRGRNILNNATRRSLVLMDEIGRGTSTFDGFPSRGLIGHRIGEKIGVALFATHYFELTGLADELPACANVHLDATEHGDLVDLHACGEGRSGQSKLRPAGGKTCRGTGHWNRSVSRAGDYLRKLEADPVRGAARARRDDAARARTRARYARGK